MELPTVEQRLAARERPEGTGVMMQSWENVLFMHWEVPYDAVRKLIPEPIEIDTFDGRAYLSITPLHIYDVRPVYFPAIPFLSQLNELNVRTYVHHNGVPGVWFFSLDANSELAVMGARMFFSLPYYEAEIKMQRKGSEVEFSSRRGSGRAKLNVNWVVGEDRPPAEPGTLDFFLLERYALYTAAKGKAYRCRINHRPWPIQRTVSISNFRSNVAEADDLPTPQGDPLLHCAGPVEVEVWPLEEIGAASSE